MIKIGTSLHLESYSNEQVHKYRCKVVEREGSILYIDYPISEETGRTSIFTKGTEFLANFVGEHNAVFRFRTEIIGKKQSNIPMLILHYPEDNLTKIQRREYVRIHTALDASIHDTQQTFPPFTTITQDVSGGGLSLLIPNTLKLEKGHNLSIWIVLPMESGAIQYIQTTSKVIRIREQENGRSNLLSIAYEKIQDKDREAIIRYCFENQLKNRRRGLS